MKSINDDVFGKLEYDVCWQKRIPITLWTKKHAITLNIEDLDEEGTITPIQKQTWSDIKDNIADIIDENLSNIAEYCKKAFKLEDATLADIGFNITPTSLVIERDGKWYILFDCTYDIEHGIALGVQNSKYTVGSQDEFL